MRSEQRAHPRVRICEPVQFDTADDARTPTAAFCTDMSLGGLRVATRRPLEVGACAAVSLISEHGEIHIDRAEVCWSAPPPKRASSQSGSMGIRFLDVSDESRVRLARVVSDHSNPPDPSDPHRDHTVIVDRVLPLAEEARTLTGWIRPSVLFEHRAYRLGAPKGTFRTLALLVALLGFALFLIQRARSVPIRGQAVPELPMVHAPAAPKIMALPEVPITPPPARQVRGPEHAGQVLAVLPFPEVDAAGMRLRLPTSPEGRHRQFELANPARWVVDVFGLDLREGRRTIRVGSACVKEIRAGQHAGFMRLVFERTATRACRLEVGRRPEALTIRTRSEDKTTAQL